MQLGLRERPEPQRWKNLFKVLLKTKVCPQSYQLALIFKLSALWSKGWSTCKHWKLFLHRDIGMSAPPVYTPFSSTGANSSHQNVGSSSSGSNKRSLPAEGDAFELSPLPPGVKVEKVYEGESILPLDTTQL